MKLYEIDSQITRILAAADESAELSPADIKILDDLQMERIDKFENICKYIKTLEAHQAGVQAELDRLEMAKRQDVRNIGQLKEYMKASLVAEGRQPGPESKINAGTFNLRLQTNGGKPAVTFPDGFIAEDLPPEFRKTVIVTDLEAILSVAANGKPLPPGIEIKRGFHLRIT